MFYENYINTYAKQRSHLRIDVEELTMHLTDGICAAFARRVSEFMERHLFLLARDNC